MDNLNDSVAAAADLALQEFYRQQGRNPNLTLSDFVVASLTRERNGKRYYEGIGASQSYDASLRDQIENGRGVGDADLLKDALDYFYAECVVKHRRLADVNFNIHLTEFCGIEGVVAGEVIGYHLSGRLSSINPALAKRLSVESPSAFERTAWQYIIKLGGLHA